MIKVSLTLYFTFYANTMVSFLVSTIHVSLKSNWGLKCDENIKLINPNDYSSDGSNDITFWDNSTVS